MKKLAKTIYLSLRRLALRPFYGPPAASIDLSSIKSILVLRFDRVGDMVLATPLLAALREEFPRAALEVLASESNAGILENHPAVDRVHALPRRGRAAFLAGLRARRFDLLIDPSWDYTLEWGRVAREICARYSVGLDIAGRGFYYNVRVPGPLTPRPAPELMLEIARGGLQRPLLARLPKIYVSDSERAAGRRRLEGAGLRGETEIILLHPGGHYESQRWPAERFAQAAAALSIPGRRWTALVGGPADQPLLRRAGGPAVETASLRDLLGVLSHAKLLVCNNSGPLHAACALGVPTLSTLGPSEAAVWAPPHPHQTLKGNPLSTIPASDVIARAKLMLGETR